MRTLLSLLILFSPVTALACGAFFCDQNQPVTQAAERILFAVDGDTVRMHIRITYQGPPTNFGWILPVTPGVEAAISSETLFQALDRLYVPSFQLITEYEEGCWPERDWGWDGGYNAPDASLAGDVGASEPPPMVQVISREAVGPYDIAVLQADTIEVLRTWLDENEYSIPAETDELLVPYLENGAHFVAVRLQSDRNSGDIVPLSLAFPGQLPSIPIKPTALASQPDMGLIVHVLGDARAIPSNFLHVEINEAAIDWQSRGANYADVVSQAVDEAGGLAFTTDYSGPVGDQLREVLAPIPAQLLAQIDQAETLADLANFPREWTTDPDFIRVIAGEVGTPEGISARAFVRCMRCFNVDLQTPVDGSAIAARLIAEVQPAREEIQRLLRENSTLTRLFSTMSAAEMNEDPIFDFNPDLPQVSALHEAIQYIPCNADNSDHDSSNAIIELADGRQFASNRETVQRQNGQTVRGVGLPAARVIQQLTVAGQPMVINEQDPMLPGGPEHTPNVDNPQVNATESGCGCDTSDTPAGGALLGLLGLLMLRRRRS